MCRMAAQPQHPASACYLPRPLHPARGRCCYLKVKPRHSPRHPAPQLQGLLPQLEEHSGPWPTGPPPSPPQATARPPAFLQRPAGVGAATHQNPISQGQAQGWHPSWYPHVTMPSHAGSPPGEGRGHLPGPWLHMVDSKQVSLRRQSPPSCQPLHGAAERSGVALRIQQHQIAPSIMHHFCFLSLPCFCC